MNGRHTRASWSPFSIAKIDVMISVAFRYEIVVTHIAIVVKTYHLQIKHKSKIYKKARSRHSHSQGCLNKQSSKRDSIDAHVVL